MNFRRRVSGGGEKQTAIVKDEKQHKRERKTSQTSAGAFVVSEPEGSKKKLKISKVFQESDSWD